jgi:hypothetical protein
MARWAIVEADTDDMMPLFAPDEDTARDHAAQATHATGIEHKVVRL